MTLLEKILRVKRQEVAERRKAAPLSELESAARAAPSVRSLRASLSRSTGAPRIIAEVKKASPSKGVIREDFEPLAVARAYARGGAAGISVLTDRQFFQGSLEHLKAIRRDLPEIPLLRKDFIIDPYQVRESRAAGADAILLILAAIDDAGLRLLAGEAASLGMEVLYEVHDAEELERLREVEPRLVGINNRDLRTFEVSLETTRRLLPRVPEGALVVSESGFSAASEIEMMRGWGVDAFLIGESLLRAPDPGEALAALIAGVASHQEERP